MKLFFPVLFCLLMTVVSADANENSSVSELKQFRNNAMDVLDNPYCRKRLKSYLKEKEPKAFIFATRKGYRAEYCDYVEGDTLDRCEKRGSNTKRNEITSPCMVFARNHILLLSRFDLGLEPREKNLLYMAERYTVDEVKKMVESGVDINQRNVRGFTPLHVAIDENNFEVVKYLVSQGADLELRNNSEDNALLIAIERKHDDMFVYLLSQGADIKSTSLKDKTEPIHLVSLEGDLKMLKIIVDKGVDVNLATIKKKRTPLHLAVRRRKFTTVKYLVEKGARINVQDKSGKTALDIAKETRNKKIIDFLIKKGAKTSDEL